MVSVERIKDYSETDSEVAAFFALFTVLFLAVFNIFRGGIFMFISLFLLVNTVIFKCCYFCHDKIIWKIGTVCFSTFSTDDAMTIRLTILLCDQVNSAWPALCG